MQYLLDTNVLSELHKVIRGRGDACVSAWLASTDLVACHVSAISLMELEIGVLRLQRRDVAQAALLRTWLETRVLPEFRGRVLPVDEAVAMRCARLHVPDPSPERDALIAATALVHGLTVVTRNTVDFQATGADLFNPWQHGMLQESRAAYAVDD